MLSIPLNSVAQITKVMGKVIDAQTREILPFVNIIFKGTTIGTRTDFNGEYALEVNSAVDSLSASFIGYVTSTKIITPHKFQTIDFELFPDKYTLGEVVIKPGTNPAEILLKKLIARKDSNSGKDIEAYQYETYSKIEFDANNISEEFKNRKIMKPFQFIFENVDTSTINGKSYLPLFLTESLSDVYYRKTPKSNKEIIKATKISGVDNESMSQFLGKMYQNINVYDNYVNVFDKNFISPIADFGLGFYKYYLTDSSFVGNNWCYKIMFKPRRKQELTFTGNFWVADTSFAVKSIDMRVADDANINFINDAVITQEFERTNNQYWIITKDKLFIDFNLVENTKSTMGFYGKKTNSYTKYIFNQPKEDAFYNTPTNISVEDGSLNKSNEFWTETRHDSLSKDEKAVYTMVDSIKTIPIFKTYVDIIQTLIMGYYVKGKFEIGPYFNIISFNDLEGARFRFGGRTSNAFSTKLMLKAHAAYGTKDETFKYGGGFMYVLNKNPRKSTGLDYKYDIEQLGESQNSFITDNILASLLRRSPNDKLSMVRELNGFYENEWFNGFSNTARFIHRDIFPLGSTKFEFSDGGQKETMNSITTSEIQFDTRFAYNEKFFYGEFERSSLGTEYPIVEIKYAYGIKGFWNGDYEYHRLQIGLNHWFNVRSFGWSKYILEAGKIWGTLPYPLLKMHEGNETYSYDEYAFNLMNYYEFVSDKYLSFYYVHHLEGFFLNRIPLMRKLKWREVGFVKGVVGSLSEANKEYTTFPTSLHSLTKPYFEAGVGVENILKVLRVNAVWRLSYLDHPNVSKFGILATLQVYF
jgi:hypothetical protein